MSYIDDSQARCEICGREVEEPTYQGTWPPRPTRILNIAERYKLNHWVWTGGLRRAISNGEIDPGCSCSDCRNRYLTRLTGRLTSYLTSPADPE